MNRFPFFPRFGCVLASALLAGRLCAAEDPAIWPAWWSSAPTTIIDTNPANTPNNWAIVNVGQLKHVATMAKAHLDTRLGLTAADWVTAYGAANPFPFSTAANPENFAAANIGQLKFIASGFYRLLSTKAADYKLADRLTALGVPAGMVSSGDGYLVPWGSAISENNSAVTIGQLKVVFGFDLSTYSPDSKYIADTDGDGLGDLEELALGTNPTNADSDGDGIPDGWERAHGLDPKNPNDASAFPPGGNQTYLTLFLAEKGVLERCAAATMPAGMQLVLRTATNAFRGVKPTGEIAAVPNP